jgi:hypothetical protein
MEKGSITIRTVEPQFIPRAHSEGCLESFCQCQTARTFLRERRSRLEYGEQGGGRHRRSERCHANRHDRLAND